MSVLNDIILAIRQRIEDAGLTVSKEPSIDEADGLPQVMVFMVGDGDKTEKARPIHLKKVTLACDLRYKFEDDWLVEGTALKDQLEAAVFKGPIMDRGDDLDGVEGVRAITPVKNTISPETENRIGTVQVHIEITYVEG